MFHCYEMKKAMKHNFFGGFGGGDVVSNSTLCLLALIYSNTISHNKEFCLCKYSVSEACILYMLNILCTYWILYFLYVCWWKESFVELLWKWNRWLTHPVSTLMWPCDDANMIRGVTVNAEFWTNYVIMINQIYILCSICPSFSSFLPSKDPFVMFCRTNC